MQAGDFPQFRAVMAGMAELYQRDLSQPLLDAYWLALGDWSFAEFQSVSAQLMKTEDFMPKPAAFHAIRKAGRVTAGELWIRVLDYARRGYNSNFPHAPGGPDDPIARRAVAAIGGYGAIANSDISKTHFLERRFCEHFEQMQDAEETREALPEITFDRRTALPTPTPIGNLLGRFSERTES